MPNEANQAVTAAETAMVILAVRLPEELFMGSVVGIFVAPETVEGISVSTETDDGISDDSSTAALGIIGSNVKEDGIEDALGVTVSRGAVVGMLVSEREYKKALLSHVFPWMFMTVLVQSKTLPKE
jgi:hypothetical protein